MLELISEFPIIPPRSASMIRPGRECYEHERLMFEYNRGAKHRLKCTEDVLYLLDRYANHDAYFQGIGWLRVRFPFSVWCRSYPDPVSSAIIVASISLSSMTSESIWQMFQAFFSFFLWHLLLPIAYLLGTATGVGFQVLGFALVLKSAV